MAVQDTRHQEAACYADSFCEKNLLGVITCYWLLGDYIATEFPGQISFAAITKTWIKEVLRELLQQKHFENQCKRKYVRKYVEMQDNCGVAFSRIQMGIFAALQHQEIVISLRLRRIRGAAQVSNYPNIKTLLP